MRLGLRRVYGLVFISQATGENLEMISLTTLGFIDMHTVAHGCCQPFRPDFIMAVSSIISGNGQWEAINGQWGQAMASGSS